MGRSLSSGQVIQSAMTTFDLVVRNARLRQVDDLVHIGITGERIAVISPTPLTGEIVLDAKANLVTESFVDGHMHLCKAYTYRSFGDAASTEYASGTMGGAMTGIELASKIKENYHESWIYENARRAALEAIRHGVLHMQAFVDTDTKARLEGIKGVMRVRDELKDVLRIEIVAFPQDGLLRDPGAESFVREAMMLGADRVGGIPWIENSDADAQEHVERMLSLAKKHDARVAMLTDDAGDASLRTTQMLATGALEHGLEGRITSCHARAMALYPEPTFRRLAALAKQAGMGFITDPHTGPLHLRALDLFDQGHAVGIGHDDIEDPYYPWGRYNFLEIAYLASHFLGAMSRKRMEDLFDMITTRAAAAIGIDGHKLAVGHEANLLIHGQADVHEVLNHHEAPKAVISRGKVVARTTTESALTI
jgi:cytosine deaminase